MLDEKKIIQLKDRYYNDISVLFEMIKVMRGRECSFLGNKEPPIRCMKIHSLKFMRSNFDAFNFKNRLYNIYASLARLENMPMFSYAPPERKLQQIEFNRNFNTYVVGYEGGLDFDADESDNMKAIWDMKDVIELFNKYKLPYYCKISGSGGHIGIPEFITKLLEPEITLIPNKIGVIGKLLKDLMALDTLDASIFDMRRIWKVDYSLDVKSGNVALPLDESQIKDFKWDMVTVDSVLGKGVRDRGRILHNSGTDEEYKERANKFVKEIVEGK